LAGKHIDARAALRRLLDGLEDPLAVRGRAREEALEAARAEERVRIARAFHARDGPKETPVKGAREAAGREAEEEGTRARASRAEIEGTNARWAALERLVARLEGKVGRAASAPPPVVVREVESLRGALERCRRLHEVARMGSTLDRSSLIAEEGALAAREKEKDADGWDHDWDFDFFF